VDDLQQGGAEEVAAEAELAVARHRLFRSWRNFPVSREPRRNLRPKIAARSLWARIEAIQHNREFLAAYRDARARWIAGDMPSFPIGTYWLRRFAHVPLAS
jgi:ABC-type Fe3+-hydroxamate transport system substrate-binding protein